MPTGSASLRRVWTAGFSVLTRAPWSKTAGARKTVRLVQGIESDYITGSIKSTARGRFVEQGVIKMLHAPGR